MRGRKQPHMLAAAATMLLLAGAGWSQQPTFFTLDNGLKACVLEDRSTDLTAVHLAIRVTADCEPEGKAGLRAILQHTMRVGWEMRVKTDDSLGFVADMQDVRGGLSTAVDWEYVGFGYTGTADTLLNGLAFLAKGVFSPEFTQEAFAGARDVVRSALLGQAQPAESTHALFRLALTGSRARAYPMGTQETIGGISLPDLYAFHRRFYIPNLAALCVAGPTPAAEVRALIERHFGSTAPGKADLPEPPAREDSDVRVASNAGLIVGGKAEIEIASLVVGVPAPAYDDPDFPVSFVIQALLGPGAAPEGRIDRDQQLWASLGLGFPPEEARKRGLIESLPPQLSQRNYLALQAYVAPARAEDVRRALLSHFEELATKPPTGAELDQVKDYLRTRNALYFDSLKGRSLLMARATALGLAGPLVMDLAAGIDKVTSQDVQQVARRFFARHGVGVEYPEVAWQ